MSFSSVRTAAIAATLAVFGGGAAHAATAFNANLAPPGVYFGAGNPNGAFTIETVDGVEVGVRAKEFKGAAPTPVGNVYNFDLGKVISFDFSFNPGADGTPVGLAGLSSLIRIVNVGTGGSANINPALFFDNATNAGAPGGFQNSQRLSFGIFNGGPVFNFGDIDYDSNVDSTYRLDFTVSGSDFAPVTSRITINQGAGAAVPEPSAWALMILGFGAAGVMLRRRERTALRV